MFDAVPISMRLVSDIETTFITSSAQWNRAINEKNRVIHIVFFAELRKKRICYHVRSYQFKLGME